MSKSILVIDTPECCRHCKLYDYVPCICLATGRFQNNISEDYKPDWCPLRYLPDKKSGNKYHNEYERGVVDGFNACLDEILKGANGNEQRTSL